MTPWNYKIRSNAASGPLSKPPVLTALFFCVLLWLGAAVYQFHKMCWDRYYPYEGRVVAIGQSWVDHVTFEQTLWEHLTIETPAGKRIDRMVGFESRVRAGIKPGDTVIKKKGFDEPVIRN